MPSGDRCPTLIVRGAPPSIDTTALLPKRPTTFTSVAAAGPASASESAAAIQSVRFIRVASAMRPIAIFRYSPSEGPGYFSDYLEARGRSEERRVGKEGRSRWEQEQKKQMEKIEQE